VAGFVREEIAMDVSFLFTDDELYTLISLAPGSSEAGRRFMAEALPGAAACDLSGLVGKNLARRVGNELALTPVVRMMSDAIARADSADLRGEKWEIRSPWVSLLCENYAYKKGTWKITPIKEAEK